MCFLDLLHFLRYLWWLFCIKPLRRSLSFKRSTFDSRTLLFLLDLCFNVFYLSFGFAARGVTGFMASISGVSFEASGRVLGSSS